MRTTAIFAFLLLWRGFLMVQPNETKFYCAACMDSDFVKVEQLYSDIKFEVFIRATHRFYGSSCSERSPKVLKCKTPVCVHTIIFYKDSTMTETEDIHSYNCAHSIGTRLPGNDGQENDNFQEGTTFNYTINENATMVVEFFYSAPNLTLAKDVIYQMANKRDDAREPFLLVPGVGTLHLWEIQFAIYCVSCLIVICFAALITMIIKWNSFPCLNQCEIHQFSRRCGFSSPSYMRFPEPVVFSELIKKCDHEVGENNSNISVFEI